MKLKTTGLFGLVFEENDLQKLGLPEYAAFTDMLTQNDLTLRDCAQIKSNHGLRGDEKTLPASLTQGENDTVLTYFAFLSAFYLEFNMIPHASQIGPDGNTHIWLTFAEIFDYTHNGAKLNERVSMNMSLLDSIQ